MTRRAWQSPLAGFSTGSQPQGKSPDDDNSLSPGLYLVATPIGNAGDISLRALKVLGACDMIVAEDTRVTAKLLAIYGISKPMTAYNDHNAQGERPKLIARLRKGARLALVSDAGTPLISDPGYKLVGAALGEGIAVNALPGASASLCALSLSGLPSDRFMFMGFLPAKAGERRTTLAEIGALRASLIFYEAPQRLAESLADMADVLGPRQGAIARELTKLHEEVRRDRLDALARHYAEAGPPKGEIVVVVGPPLDAAPDLARIDDALAKALPFMPVKAAAELIAELSDAPRRMVYARALEWKRHGDQG